MTVCANIHIYDAIPHPLTKPLVGNLLNIGSELHIYRLQQLSAKDKRDAQARKLYNPGKRA